ncbi:Rieske (2Fe-2S) protein [Spirilliplanes yamanashiensis]|uniref:Iron-sulfur protein n=1 Tax=Spirilliplanes yamanashiensis TaxID=42233 RepID=A0A8J3Y8D5_9ACTN|nr:Rieske (2Fe-2S) protein [Spirilliplanes yamanashiensis]MDP9817067.1 Rieske Fe-S protein [Spirilliplanes yamanashiensis]GIJ03277.1 iron-sulfur protein [Spirilliplanes yamanashiensis]
MTDVQPAHDTDRATAAPVRLGTPSTRRGLLAGAGALGATALLAACGTEQPTDGVGYGTGTGGEPIPAGSANPGTGNDGGGDTGNSGGGAALAAVADIPVGGGIILATMVITQPTEGEFKAFDKKCTHQGCPVTEVNNGEINCKCHNSSFSIEDGSPTGGPARQALAEKQVKVDGDNIVEA